MNKGLIEIKANELTLEAILLQDLTIEFDDLNEQVISEMRFDTIIFQRELNKHKNIQKKNQWKNSRN